MNTSVILKQIPTIQIGTVTFYSINFIVDKLNQHNHSLDDFIVNFPNLRNIGYADSLSNKDFDYSLYSVLCQQISDADDKQETISLTFDTYIKLCKPSNIISKDKLYYGTFQAAISILCYVNSEFHVAMISEVSDANPNLLRDFLSKNNL